MRKLTRDEVRKPVRLRMKSCCDAEEISAAEDIIGQERALRALEFGIDIRDAGFNIFVAGHPGTGRTTAVENFLRLRAAGLPAPCDWCYVHNFADSYAPLAIGLPAGRGTGFRARIEALVEEVVRAVRSLFQSEEYIQNRDEVVSRFQRRKEQLFEALNREAAEKGMTIQATQMGPLIVPLGPDGNPLSPQEWTALDESVREGLEQKRKELEEELQQSLRKARTIDRDAREAVREFERKFAATMTGYLFEAAQEEYGAAPGVEGYLHGIRDDVLDHLELFKEGEGKQPQPVNPFTGGETPLEVLLKKYQVNVIINNAQLSGAPVVVENHPSFTRLFGKLEREVRFGALLSDFTMIRPGSLHQANGGYLVIPVDELFKFPLVYDTLKRSLKARHAVIEDPMELLGYLSSKTLNPQPIPIDVKVVLIGTPYHFSLLNQYDEDFRELFKVKAEFDTVMEKNRENIGQFASFICMLCRKEGLSHLSGDAMGVLLQSASRLAGDATKLSTRFGELADILREASFYARQESASAVSADHVRQAVAERRYRHNLINEKIQEMIRRGTIQIPVDGSRTGIVCGLAVLDTGSISFGRPSRISASVVPGREGVVDIEREAKLSGSIHTKGVLILEGWLRHRFGREKPLSLAARVVFEQSYGMVDGDSASSTEAYAILSALAGLPVRQDIAVTGSINQRGEVQAIGGVNEKVEGFFDVCRLSGLTGRQGVVIPADNVEHLIVREDVAEAVAAGQFHLWAVSHVDEGIELLTQTPAGSPDARGRYPKGTVNALVAAALEKFRKSLEAKPQAKAGRPARNRPAKARVAPPKKPTGRRRTNR